MTTKEKLIDAVAKMPDDAVAGVLLIKQPDGKLGVVSPLIPAALMVGMIGEALVAIAHNATPPTPATPPAPTAATPR